MPLSAATEFAGTESAGADASLDVGPRFATWSAPGCPSMWPRSNTSGHRPARRADGGFGERTAQGCTGVREMSWEQGFTPSNPSRAGRLLTGFMTRGRPRGLFVAARSCGVGCC
jgi:hypothetical protein